MKKLWYVGIMSLGLCNTIYAAERVSEFSNDKVNVWNTAIAPGKPEQLTMHRHDKDRVVVAMSDGILKIVDNHQQVRYMKLEKGKSYFLPKDVEGEMHTDENISSKPIKVVVIELN
jgi:beta-alanine degradation protein BauB